MSSTMLKTILAVFALLSALVAATAAQGGDTSSTIVLLVCAIVFAIATYYGDGFPDVVKAVAKTTKKHVFMAL